MSEVKYTEHSKLDGGYSVGDMKVASFEKNYTTDATITNSGGPEEDSQIVRLTHRIYESCEELDKSLNKLQSKHNQLFGGEPSSKEGLEPHPVEPGEYGKLQDAIMSIQEAVSSHSKLTDDFLGKL